VVSHHPNAVPTRSQQGGDAFCNFCEKRVDVLGQLPAARMSLAVDVAEFAPRVALAVAVLGTVQHLPVVVVQQLLQVVAALERLARGGDARFKVIAVVGAADLGSALAKQPPCRLRSRWATPSSSWLLLPGSRAPPGPSRVGEPRQSAGHPQTARTRPWRRRRPWRWRSFHRGSSIHPPAFAGSAQTPPARVDRSPESPSSRRQRRIGLSTQASAASTASSARQP
jgi:hypothetical protein